MPMPPASFTPDYPWLNRAIVLAILFGYCSVIMVTLLGQSRVFLSMSRDGLLPPFFSHINEKFRTPARSNLLFMVVVGLLAAFVPARVAGEMTSIGTLFAFTLVCAAVLIVRKSMPEVHRAFKTPFCAGRTDSRNPDLPVHDAFPSGGYLDSIGIMDANRSGRICLLWSKTQQTGATHTAPTRTYHTQHDRYCLICLICYHWIMASANRGLGRR